MAIRAFAAAVFLCGWLSVPNLLRASDWVSLSSGSWFDSANWSAGVPNGGGATAVFPFTNSFNDFQVHLPGDVTLGSFITSNSRMQQVNGPGKLVFDASAPGAVPLLKMELASSGSLNINTPVVLADNALHLNLPTESHRLSFMQGFAPTNAQLTLDGRGSVSFVGDYTAWTGSLLLDSGSATFYGSAAADVTLDGGSLTLRANHLGDVIFKKGALSSVGDGSLSGKLVLDAGNTAYYQSGWDFQFLGGSEGPGNFVVNDSRNLTIGGAGLGHDGNLQIVTSRVTVAAPLHHSGGTVLSQDNSRLTIDALGSLVGTGVTTVNNSSVLSVAEPAGNDATLHSASPNSVKLLGGGLALRADIAPGPFLHPDSTGGTLLINNVANYTAGGQTLDFTQLPSGANLKIAADNRESSEESGLGAALQIIPANQTYRFGVGSGMLNVNTPLGDTNGTPNGLSIESATATTLSGVRLAAANTYTGVTTVSGGVLEVNHAQALGATSAGTTINGPRARVEVNAPVAEPFEVNGATLNFNAGSQGASSPVTINGGELAFKQGSQGTTSPITMNGGQVRLEWPGTFNMPVVVGAGANTFGGTANFFENQQQAKFTGGSSGEGDLTIGNVVVQGAPLAHDGNLTLWGEVALKSANTYSGTTTVRGNTYDTVRVQHPQALSDPDKTVTIEGGALALDAAVANDFLVRNGALISNLPSAPAGSVTVAPGNGQSAGVGGTGHFGDVVLAPSQGGQVGIGAAIYDGVISGPSRINSSGGTLNGNNTFTGVLRLYGGTINVNHANGLGSVDAGTIVEEGVLNLNAPSAEAVLLTRYATANVNSQVAQLPIVAPGSEATIRINAPGEYQDSVDIIDGRLEINAETSIEGVYLRGATAGLKISPGQSLHVGDGGLQWHSGSLSGQFSGSGALHKQGVSTGKLSGEFSYDGEVVVDRGLLQVATTGASLTTLTTANPFASLQFLQGRTYGGDIHLTSFAPNALGADLTAVWDYESPGPLVLQGDIEVGHYGSITARNTTIEIEGPIHGNRLIAGGVELRNAMNDYTGTTEVRGDMMLRGEGRILNSSEVVLPRGSTFSLYNEDASNLGDRVNDATSVTMSGGALTIRAPHGQHSSETLGALTFARGHSTIDATLPNDASSTELTFASIAREPGSTAFFDVNSRAQVKFNQEPTLSNGMIGAWATTYGDSNRFRFATYGPNGVEPLNTYVSDLQSAGANDNVKLEAGALLTANKSVHSLTGDDSNGPIGPLDLGGHRLTLLSGGVLNMTINNGQITAGSEAGAELVMSGVVGTANIVDNDAGAVNVVFPYGGRLTGTNTYSGSTTLNDRELYVLSPQALPEGTDLVLNGGILKFGLDASHTFLVDRFVLRGNATASYGGYAKLQPTEAILEEGKIEGLEFVGSGELMKQGPGTVTIHGQNPNFTGNISVREGVLDALYDQVVGTGTIEISGGVFASRSSSRTTFSNPIRLAGGALAVGDSQYSGPIAVETDSVLLAEFAPTQFAVGGLLSGPISGDGALTIESGPSYDRMNVIELRGDNVNFHGPVAIHGGVVRVGHQSSLGTGDVTIGPAGRLELENAVTANDITIRGGELASRGFEPAVTGLVTIEERGFAGGFSDLTLSGGLRFTENARLTKLGSDKLAIGGSIYVNGANTIFVPQGELAIDGAIVPESEEAILDVVTGNFDDAPLNLSLTVPQGTSINIRKFGASALVQTSGAGRFLAGNGAIQNDVVLSNAGELRPGASVGALTVGRNVEWGADGVYQWQINDALGAAGDKNGGWDTLLVQGNLTVAATPADPFVIRLQSLNASGGAGLLENFDAFANYAWVIASADGLLNFSPELFAVNDAAFRQLWGASPLGEFGLASEGADVLLTYAPASSIPGDAWPFDARVDLNDLNAVRNHFGQSGDLGMPGDLYPFDGHVDLHDLNLVRNNFGALAASSSVPEPSAQLLVLIAAGAAWMRHRIRRRVARA